MDLVYGAIPAPDKDEVKSMIMAACHALNSYGVTSSQTDDYCTFRNLKWNVIHEPTENWRQRENLQYVFMNKVTSLPERNWKISWLPGTGPAPDQIFSGQVR